MSGTREAAQALRRFAARFGDFGAARAVDVSVEERSANSATMVATTVIGAMTGRNGSIGSGDVHHELVAHAGSHLQSPGVEDPPLQIDSNDLCLGDG